MPRHRQSPLSLLIISTAAFVGVVCAQPLDAFRIIVGPTARGVNATAAPGDFDGDGTLDVAVKHDSNGDWTVDYAVNGLGYWDEVFGGFGGADYVPAPADYDGDGKTDLSTKDMWGNWRIDFASNGFADWDATYTGYGGEDAHPLPRDYDGDGKADLSVKTDAGWWNIDYSANGFGRWDRAVGGFGGPETEAVPADYDGDGKADLSIKNTHWYIDYASNGYRAPASWEAGRDDPVGGAGYHPVPADYDGDRRADIAVKTDDGRWLIDYAANRFQGWDRSMTGYGAAYFRPLPADYDGDGVADVVMRDDDGYWYVDYAVNGIADWERIWNPEILTLSPGRAITAEDVRQFDAWWMKPYDRQSGPGGIGWTQYTFAQSFEAGVWAIAERMSAMARMFELTRGLRYLVHLKELATIVLANRDDQRADWGTRMDGLRGNRVMAAWGVRRVSYGNYHHSSIVVAGRYAYPIAAFARIVAESPELHQAYGAFAKDAATKLLDTMDAFLPELKTGGPVGAVENYFFNPPAYRTLLTEERCKAAYKQALGEPGADPAALIDEKRACDQRRPVAGLAVGNNENLAFVMALIELSRALDTDFYRTGLTPARAAYIRTVARVTIPRIVARSHRYFANNWRLKVKSLTKFWLIWDHANIDYRRQVEDTNHGALDMMYLGLLMRDIARLDALAASASESIEVTPEQKTLLANTFRLGVASGANFARRVDGTKPTADQPPDFYNGCEGWVTLSQFDPRVFDKCAEVTLRVRDKFARPTQPYLSAGHYSALLEMKRFRR